MEVDSRLIDLVEREKTARGRARLGNWLLAVAGTLCLMPMIFIPIWFFNANQLGRLVGIGFACTFLLIIPMSFVRNWNNKVQLCAARVQIELENAQRIGRICPKCSYLMDGLSVCPECGPI